MIHVLFDVGGWFFWTLLVIALLVVADRIKEGSLIGSISFFSLFLAVFISFSNSCTYLYPMVESVNLMVVLEFLAVYILIGVVWSIVYWYLNIRSQANKILLFKLEWCEINNVDVSVKFKMLDISRKVSLCNYISERISEVCIKGISRNYITHSFSRYPSNISDEGYSDQLDSKFINMVVPSPARNKGVIVTWMSLWPLVMLWWVVGDLFVNIWSIIANKTKAIFAAISYYASRDLTKGF